MEQIIIAILVFVAVICLGGSLVSVRRGKKKQIEVQLEMVQAPSAAPSAGPGVQGTAMDALGSVGRMFGGQKGSDRLRTDLMRAGFHGGTAVMAYMGAKVLLMAMGVLLLSLLLLLTKYSLGTRGALIILGGACFYFIPNIYIYSRGRRRCDEVHRHLPDAMDLLEICASSGMGMDAAWNSVTDEIRHVSPILADEMALTNLEIHLGATRAIALRHMADRTGDEDLSSLVSIILQSERFGTSIASALQTFAGTMREIRSQRAEEMAEKLAVKLLFPLVVFIFPALMIVIVGPASITLIKVFGGLGP